ncbi:hypothetical protein [Anaeromyxobacter oryzae]|uniref:N-acetyltransferase domain-containing protein n=1 Tax=Anaeromyxobacter oryzae TaxID=2918170 RepID=A0ABM7WP86_9BACT|nr:hypothetical protein [Anaeromyxobacter oryzae]BDG01287.1 hypothetical protein AMOR_02830 [Anaeromyxobacter oryzae]
MPELRVAPAGPGELEAFVDLAAALRGGDPDFIPPFRASALGEVAGAAVPGGAIQPYLARRGGTPVGRVAALVHPRLLDEAGRALGQVGFYECADDPEAAAALLAAATGWLRARGCARAVGPMNGGAHRAYRLLTHGFDTDPYLTEPRTPPRYVDHFEAAGFAPVFRWTAHEQGRDAVAALARTMAHVARRAPWRIEPLEDRDPAAVLPRLHALLDRAWAGYPGYVPFPLDELARLFGPLLVVLPPRHLQLVVDAGGRDVGFGYMLPDWIDEVRALSGEAAGWGRWMGGPLPRRVVFHTVAVAPEARSGAAVAGLVAAGCRDALDAGYERFVFALTRADFRAHVRRFPATRCYALYGREL